MPSLPTALALGAALLCATALPARAGGDAASRDAGKAASSRSFFATSLVERPEAAGLVLAPARHGDVTPEIERAGGARPKGRLALGLARRASIAASVDSSRPRAGSTVVGVSLDF